MADYETAQPHSVEEERPMNDALKGQIASIKDFLPPTSTAMTEMLALLGNDDVDLRKFALIIEKDPSMVVNVLRVANSAFYGLPNRVKTIDHALTMVGLKEVTSLCIAWMANRALQAKPGQKTVNLQLLWRHCVATGVFARLFASEFRLFVNGNFYLAGLMHDVGKIVLDRFFHDAYLEVMRIASTENILMTDAEIKVIGESHDTVGKWLLEAWGLPSIYVEVAGCHHSALTASGENRMMVALIALADEMARLRGFGFGRYGGGDVLEETEAFGIIVQQAPHVTNGDLAEFIKDLDRIDSDIAEIEKVMYQG